MDLFKIGKLELSHVNLTFVAELLRTLLLNIQQSIEEVEALIQDARTQ